MRLCHTIDRYKATDRIVYKLLECIGYTIVYQIIKYDTQSETSTYIARNVKSKDAIMLIWNDVLHGEQK